MKKHGALATTVDCTSIVEQQRQQHHVYDSICTKSVNNSLTASTAAPSTIVLVKNQGRMMRDRCLRGEKRYEQMGSSANASVIIIYYRSNSTTPQKQAEPLSEVLLASTGWSGPHARLIIIYGGQIFE